MTFNGKTHDEINAIMKRFLPETASSDAADYPMSRARWLQPNETTPELCFVKHGEADGPPMKGYVWGQGANGKGYYYLLTKEAHQILCQKIMDHAHGGQGGGCFGPKGDTTTVGDISHNDWDVLRRIFHARSLSTVPNDKQVEDGAPKDAENTAKADHRRKRGNQVVQVIANVVSGLIG